VQDDDFVQLLVAFFFVPSHTFGILFIKSRIIELPQNRFFFCKSEKIVTIVILVHNIIENTTIEESIWILIVYFIRSALFGSVHEIIIHDIENTVNC
jgi:hypothetical protein